MIDKVVYTFTNENEENIPAMGSFRLGTMKEGRPWVFFNMEALLYHSKEEVPAERLEIVKEGILELCVHEFAHSMQEYLDMELSEAVVDRILANYTEKQWITRTDEPDVETPMVDARSAIEYMETIRSCRTIEEARQMIDDIIPSLKSFAYTGKQV
jgi:hypothetical protein